MSYNEQFKKYELIPDQEFDFAVQDSLIANSSLAGTPKKISIDILKRFFKNYLSVIALVVFLLIIIISIIVPIVSPYSENKVVSGVSIEFIKELPPSYAPIVNETLNQISIEQIIATFNKNNAGTSIPELTYNDFLMNPELLITASNGIVENVIKLEAGNFNIIYNKYALVSLMQKFLGANGNEQGLSVLLGTDKFGFDIWTRTWFATRESLLLAILVVLVEGIIGITIGSYLGFFVGTWIDNILTRFIDLIKNIPVTIWFLLFVSFFPNITFWNLFASLILIGWISPVYQTRLWIITVKDQEFVKASQAIGANVNRRIFSHALPMIFGKLATSLVSRIIFIIFLISSLAFLGFLPANAPANLGLVLNQALGQANFWALGLPSIILLLISLSTQFIANGIHDALDPQAQKGRR
ncbi:MAG: ABC transporter permease subunit [Metamycoplasmataceae bacterium]